MVTENIAMNNFCYPLYLYKNDPLKIIYIYSLHIQSVHLEFSFFLRHLPFLRPELSDATASRHSASRPLRASSSFF
jgi:hypothetical protein